ncbi:hypothetical protein R6Q59_016366, partial [Mikania micrantha]
MVTNLQQSIYQHSRLAGFIGVCLLDFLFIRRLKKYNHKVLFGHTSYAD